MYMYTDMLHVHVHGTCYPLFGYILTLLSAQLLAVCSPPPVAASASPSPCWLVAPAAGQPWPQQPSSYPTPCPVEIAHSEYAAVGGKTSNGVQ